ncbi:MAG: transposase family protein [Okeania sp. SIO3C4]|nr:transposase family protein [Okeania sp. SIO3C4]
MADQELIIDSTEQERERPTDNDEQKKYYSGYKKKHSFKNMFITLPQGKDIVDVRLGDPGPTSDVSQFRAEQKKFSQDQQFRGDTGYQGEVQIRTPHKCSKKKELTAEQKDENIAFAKQRIYVEHVIRGIKIFRVAQQRFRLRASKYHQVIRVICGLSRFRISMLVLPNKTSLNNDTS